MREKHLLFVSYELHPINPGGCGVFLWHAINELLENRDFKISLLLDMPKHECELFEKKYKQNIKNNENLEIYCLSEIIKNEKFGLDVFNNIFLYKSYQFYRGIKFICSKKNIDYIEFFDYVGVGYYTVRAKKYEGEFGEAKIGIRGHCTVDLMDLEQNQIDFNQEKVEMYQMEKLAIRDCDVLLLQAKSWGEIYRNRYGIEKDKILISPPPMNNTSFPKYDIDECNENGVLFYGRVFQLKGVDQFIESAVICLNSAKIKNMKFYIVGYDSNTCNGESYTEFLKKKIPVEFKENFIFTGKVNHEQLKGILGKIKVAVFPNYVESFCYSIHELYEAGVPIICRSIPAFDDYFTNKKNCLKFYNSSFDLAELINLAIQDEELRKRISYPYPVIEGYNFVENYIKIFKSESQIIKSNTQLEKISAIVILENDKRHEIEEFSEIIDRVFYLKKSKNGRVDFLGGKYDLVNENEIKNQGITSKYVIILNEKDRIDEAFLIRGINVLRSSTAKFVTSIYRNNLGQVIHDKRDLYVDDYSNNDLNLKPAILKCEKFTSIEEIFDFRFGSHGLTEQLHTEGYTIPSLYNDYLCDNKINSIKSNQLLYVHRKSIGKEWNPFDLKNLSDKVELPKSEVSKEREIYHEMKKKVMSLKGIKGLLCEKLLSIIYKLVKK